MTPARTTGLQGTTRNRLVRALAARHAEGRKALIPYIMAGDPDESATERLVGLLAEAGADAVELGVPFSDPIADGPVNQRAGFRALGRGMSLGRALEMVARIRRNVEVPLLFMTYYNLFLHRGLATFCREATEAGLDGVITADLPPEDGGDLAAAAKAAGLATVFLLAPTSTEERIRTVAGVSTGFIYCVSRTGVTGVRDEVPPGARGARAPDQGRDRNAGLRRLRHQPPESGAAGGPVCGRCDRRQRPGQDARGRSRGSCPGWRVRARPQSRGVRRLGSHPRAGGAHVDSAARGA